MNSFCAAVVGNDCPRISFEHSAGAFPDRHGDAVHRGDVREGTEKRSFHETVISILYTIECSEGSFDV